jgi:hypothetical protein
MPVLAKRQGIKKPPSLYENRVRRFLQELAGMSLGAACRKRNSIKIKHLNHSMPFQRHKVYEGNFK